jgi:serine/threonine protein kinase
MFKNGQIVGNRYLITDHCSSDGGMGELFFVEDILVESKKLVLKYCKHSDEEIKNRFRREVRVMEGLNGNFYIAPIVYSDLTNNPPYFVMPYYEHGDLSKNLKLICKSLESVEFCFNRMLDCVEVLHEKGIFHRDIKPQNFLVGNQTIVISDLGLCTQQNSETAFTRSSSAFGTQGYMPPEFQFEGGFKDANAASDIFMLGVTFFEILANINQSLTNRYSLPPKLLDTINIARAVDQSQRFQSIKSFRASLTIAFDIAFGRMSKSVGIFGIHQMITDRWSSQQSISLDEISLFFNEFEKLNYEDSQRACLSFTRELFEIISFTQVPVSALQHFLKSYRAMASDSEYPWSFAEEIANNMKYLFNSSYIIGTLKAEALNIAIIASIKQNRFAAMDTCSTMIKSVTDNDMDLAHGVANAIVQNRHFFIESIDPLECRSGLIRQTIQRFNTENDPSIYRFTQNPFPR